VATIAVREADPSGRAGPARYAQQPRSSPGTVAGAFKTTIMMRALRLSTSAAGTVVDSLEP
jgi:hypothetical protein